MVQPLAVLVCRCILTSCLVGIYADDIVTLGVW